MHLNLNIANLLSQSGVSSTLNTAVNGLTGKTGSLVLPSTGIFVWNVVFGIIGFGFFVYGKKQKKIIPLFVGMALMVFPFFVSNVYWLAGIGAVLTAVPFFARA